MAYYAGVDIGTTNTKALVYDPAVGRVVAVASRPTIACHPRPGWTEFSADEVWRGVVECLREVTSGRRESIAGVAVASMAEAGVPLDSAGRVLYPIIAWHDPRTQPQVDRWRDWVGERRIFAITGQPLQAKFSVNKLLWLRENEPNVSAATRKWLCLEDYINWKLSGEYGISESLASRTMLFDQREKAWSAELLDRAELSADLLSTPHPSGTPIGRVTARAAEETGLPVGAIVATGGHDHLCGSLAAGVTGTGALLDSMGTAEGCVLVANEYAPDERLLRGAYCTYAHVIPGRYVVIFGLNVCGGALDWLVGQLWPEAAASPAARSKAFAEALAAAEFVPPGSDGLFCLPHFAGASSPWGDEAGKAAFVGLTTTHSRGHLVRALLEGLSYWLRENLDVLSRIVAIPQGREATAIGGGTRARLLIQTKADVTNRTIRVPDVPEATALGAALLAGLGAGAFASADEAAASVRRPTIVFEPDAERAEKYRRYYEIYHEIYPALRAVDERIHNAFWSGGRLR